MIKISKKLFLVIILSLTSCLKQSTEKIDNIAYQEENYQARLEACKDFEIDNALVHKNVLNFFVCSSWEKNHPYLYGAIKNIPDSSWNTLTGVFNKILIQDRTNRDIALSSIKRLDDSGAFDYMVNVVNALNKQNFYSGLYEISNCWVSGNCRGNKTSTDKDLQELISIGRKSKPVIDLLEKFLTIYVTLDEKSYEATLSILREISGMENVEEDVVDIMDDLFDDKAGTSSSFQMLSGLSKNKVTSSYLKKINKSSLSGLLEYALGSPGLSFKLEVMQGLLDNSIECQEDVKLSLEKRTESLILSSKDSSIDQNINAYTNAISELKIADQLCPGIDGPYKNSNSHDGEVKISEMLYETLTLLNDNRNAELTRNVLGMFGDLNAKQLMRKLNNKAIITLFKIISKNRESVDRINQKLLDLHNGKNWESVEIVEKIANHFFSLLEKQETLDAIKSTWNYFNREEKRFFVEFVLEHIKEPQHLKGLANFYLETIGIIEPHWDEVIDSFEQGGSSNLAKVMNDHAKELKGELVLDDFRSFFSKKNVFKILQVLSQGFVVQPKPPLTFTQDDSQSTPTDNYETSLHYLNVDAMECLRQYAKSEGGLLSISTVVSKECVSILGSYSDIVRTLKIGSLGRSFDSEWIKSEEKFGLLDRWGLLSSNSIAHFLRIFSSEKGIVDGFKLKEFIHLFEKIVSDKNTNEALINLRDKFSNNKESKSAFSNILLAFTESLNKLFYQTENKDLIQLIGDFIEWRSSTERKLARENKPEFREEFSCEKVFKGKKTGLSCADTGVLTESIKAIARDLIRNTGADHTALDLLINIVSAHSPNFAEIKKLFGDKKFKISDVIKMMTDLHYEAPVKKVEYSADLILEKGDLAYLNGVGELGYGRFEDEVDSFSVMEKIEGVTRNIRFDNNYMGVHFLNAIVQNEEYDNLVNKKWKLLRKCTGIKFCGKWMSKTEIALARNSVTFFEGLSEVNSDKFRHSDPFRMFFSPFVLSSDPELQNDSLVKKRILGMYIEIPILFSKKKLDQHNGRILTRLTMLSFFTNLSRYIKKISARKAVSIDEIVNDPNFVEFDSNFMSSEDSSTYILPIKRILNFIETEEGSRKLNSWIDIIKTMNETDFAILEDTIFNISEIVNGAGEMKRSVELLAEALITLNPNDVQLIMGQSQFSQMIHSAYEASAFIKYFYRKNEVTKQFVIKSVKHVLDKFAQESEISNLINNVSTLLAAFAKDENWLNTNVQLINATAAMLDKNESQIEANLKLLSSYLARSKFPFRYLELINSNRICVDVGCRDNNPHFNETGKLLFSLLTDNKMQLIEKLIEISKQLPEKDIDEMINHINQSLSL